MKKRLALVAALGMIVLSSAGIVTFISAQDAAGQGSPASRPDAGAQAVRLASAAGAPFSLQAADRGDAPAEPAISARVADRLYQGPGKRLYLVSADSGVLASADGGKTWSGRGAGLPQRSVYPFRAQKPPLVTSLAIDPSNGDRIAVTLPDSVFLSENGGETWQKVEMREPLKPNDHLTSVALHPTNPRGLLVGTSFHGFFETSNGGAAWTELTARLTSLTFGDGSCEEISALAYSPTDPTLIYFGLGFGNGLYTYRAGASAPVRVDFPGDSGRSPIRDIWFHEAEGRAPSLSSVPSGSPAASPTGAARSTGVADARWDMVVRTANARWALSGRRGAWRLEEALPSGIAADPAAAQRRELASGKFGLYISGNHANGRSFDALLALSRAKGLNSIVVDFKDEFGILLYDSNLEEPKRIGAVRPRFSASEIAAKAHANGLYLIARVVVFRDRQLYNADSNANAVWDRVSKAPWRYLKKSVNPDTGEESLFQGEYWVDPYSEAVWRYNTDIARELEERGVDEVQFDYIRFPSDGELSRITYRARREGMGKLEALESFLAMAREAVRIPLSTDVYGYCGWTRISSWVAQNIEIFSRYVDVISPMYYPSHFPRSFLGSMEYLPRARYIYSEGGDRAAEIVQGRSVIRPYVQAFRIGGELSFSPAVYSSYLMSQIEGVLMGASSGFTLWNASNDYYMVTMPLSPLIAGGQAPVAVEGRAR